jgi:hypothetical protein
MVLKEYQEHPLYLPGTFVPKETIDIEQIPDRKNKTPEEEIRTVLQDLCGISNDRVSFNYWPIRGSELMINLPPRDFSIEEKQVLWVILAAYDFKIDETRDSSVTYHTTRYAIEKVVAWKDESNF